MLFVPHVGALGTGLGTLVDGRLGEVVEYRGEHGHTGVLTLCPAPDS